MWNRGIVVAWVWLIAAAFLTGCVTFPTEDARTFAGAFQEARHAGDALLDKVSPIAVEIEERAGIRSPAVVCREDFTGTPKCFALPTVGGGRLEPRDIAVRRIALDLITAYNEVLLDLAEGKSAAEVRTRLAGLAELASSALGLLGVANPAVAALPALQGPFLDLVTRFERARVNVVARQAVVRGRQPIKGILAGLRQDAPILYEIYRADRLKDAVDARARGDATEANAIVEDIKQFHASIAAYVALLDSTSEALEALAEAAEAGGQLSVANLRTTIQEAIEIRERSNAFWTAIRQVRG